MTENKKIRVVIVDDSAFMRIALERMLKEDPSIEVVGSAANGVEAVSRAIKLKPDVITLDVEMPIMDGLQALKEIMHICPIPVIMVSSLTHEGAKVTLDALDLGAVDYVPKPGSTFSTNILQLKNELATKIHNAAGSKPHALKLEFTHKSNGISFSKSSEHIINKAVFIGASTGGPPALQKILSSINSNIPAPIIIAQHMPKAFTSAFASRLNNICGIRVKEASDGEQLMNSIAYVCPGDHQTKVVRQLDGRCFFSITSKEVEKDIFAPCINTLFFSAAKEFSHNAIGIILTGMGEDGVRGLRNIKMVGGLTMAQDRASSVVYGMPRAAMEQQAAVRILPLEEIASEIEIALK